MVARRDCSEPRSGVSRSTRRKGLKAISSWVGGQRCSLEFVQAGGASSVELTQASPAGQPHLSEAWMCSPRPVSSKAAI